MSLALAEILYKQTGDSGIDRMRGSHSHHGLETAWGDNFNPNAPIDFSASSLKAKRALKSGNIGYGTFELWHRSAREHPLGGKRTTKTENGQSSGFISLFQGSNDRLPVVPAGGLSLLDCYRSLPGMSQFLTARGLKPSLARATIRQEVNVIEEFVQSQITFHPDPSEILSRVYEKILVQPLGCMRIGIVEHQSGLTIRWKHDSDDLRYGINLPPSIQLEDNMIHFFSEIDCLNEFGIMYVGLYILGMYARYYPDRWMADVESSSELALSALDFLDICQERLPACTLGEFSGVMRVRGGAYV